MAWTSAALGAKVVSDYLHIDNLRADLVVGKFWDKTDSTATKYTQVYHDSTSGYLSTSSGTLILSAQNGLVAAYTAGVNSRFIVYNTDTTVSFDINIADGAIYYNHATNPFKIAAVSALIRLQTSAGARAKLQFYDNTLTAWKTVHIDNGAWVIA